MGDRANIAIKQETDDKENPTYIYLYSHWGGSELPQTLQQALIRGEDRWTDEAYLTRIIFSEMIQDNVLDETGFGISTNICDNEHNIIYVDVQKNTVTIGNDTWRFKTFVTLGEKTFENY